jgi:hypothetical protein
MLQGLFSMAWRGGTADGAVWDGEKQGLRGSGGCDGNGHGPAGKDGAAGNADSGVAAGLVAERCGEAEVSGLGRETKFWVRRQVTGYLSPGVCGRKI